MKAEPKFDLTRLRRWIGWVLLVMALAELLYGVTSVQYLGLHRAGLSDRVSEAEYAARQDGFAILEGFMMQLYRVALFASLILGAVWTYGAAHNAGRLVPDEERISSLGAVLWHIVPIAQWFMPYKAMKQIYNSSLRPPAPLNAKPPLLLPLWWGAWLVTQALAVLGGVLFMAENQTVSVYGTVFVELINTLLGVLSIYLWWMVVSIITDMQMAARPDATNVSAPEVVQ